MTLENFDEEKKMLLGLILGAERDKANDLLDQIASKTSYRSMIFSVLEPVLSQIGDMWMTEEVSLAQGYVAGKVAEDILGKMISSGECSQEEMESKGSVVLGNIEDDYHALGRKMVGTFLRMAGWKVYDLGNDVTAEEFVSKAIEVNASVIGVSAMMYSTAENIKKLRQKIDDQGLKDKIMLAVGGAVFKLRPDLVQEVGGDGTANSAVNAPKLFNQLFESIQTGKSL